MIAIDKNVLVRFVVADHPEQFERAMVLIRDNTIFVGLTVFLEAEWVLRSVYGATREEIATAFLGVAGLPNVTVESPAVLIEAVAAYRKGMDFADALHVAAAAESNVAEFATFDEDLGKRSRSALRHVRVLNI